MQAADEARALAARVGGRSELLDVRLVRSQVEHIAFPEPGHQLKYDLEVNPTAQYAEGDRFLIVTVDFNMAIQQVEAGEAAEAGEPAEAAEAAEPAEAGELADVGEDQISEVASVNFTFAALFEVSPEDSFDEAEIKAFGNTTGVFSVYPYAREYVQDVTGRIGLPPLTMGLYKIDPSQVGLEGPAKD